MDILTILSIGLLTFAFVNILLAYKSVRDSNRRLETFRRRIQREDDRMDSIGRLLELRTRLEREQRESYRPHRFPSRRDVTRTREGTIVHTELDEYFSDEETSGDLMDYIAKRRKELKEEHQKEQKEKEQQLKIEKAKEKEKQKYNKNRTSRTAKAAKLLDEQEGTKKRQKK